MREGEYCPAIRELAGVICPDWRAVVPVWSTFALQHDFNLQADTGKDLRNFLEEAINAAKGKGLLRRFAAMLIGAGLADWKTMGQHVDRLLGEGSLELQAYQNNTFVPKNALEAGKRLVDACEHVCRIDLWDGYRFVQKGTGVLIRPTLVATARHVIDSLLQKNGDGSLKKRRDGSLEARPGTVGQLRVVFGYMDDYLPGKAKVVPSGPGKAAKLHEQWLAWGSDALPAELDQTIHFDDVRGLAEPDGPWDLAIIRLAEPPLPGFVGQKLLVEPSPGTPFEVHVLHHPHGDDASGLPLLWSIGALDPRLITPPLRVLHNANTERGSSGAPVFDGQFRIVALHQGGAPLDRSARPVEDGGPKRNRAVPVAYWSGMLDNIERGVPSTHYLVTVPAYEGEPEQPVIGRRKTQERILLALRGDATPEQRLIVVRGQPGQGRRFTARLARALAVPAGAVLRSLDAFNLQADDAVSAADRMLRSFGGLRLSDAGITEQTTPQRDWQRRTAPALARALDGLAKRESGTWLVIYGLDEAKLADAKGVPILLDGLVQAVHDCRRLRLVLVGWQGRLPGGFTEPAEELTPPRSRDVLDYLLLRYSPAGTPVNLKELQAIASSAAPADDRTPAMTYPDMLQVIAVHEARFARDTKKALLAQSTVPTSTVEPQAGADTAGMLVG